MRPRRRETRSKHAVGSQMESWVLQAWGQCVATQEILCSFPSCQGCCPALSGREWGSPSRSSLPLLYRLWPQQPHSGAAGRTALPGSIIISSSSSSRPGAGPCTCSQQGASQVSAPAGCSGQDHSLLLWAPAPRLGPQSSSSESVWELGRGGLGCIAAEVLLARTLSQLFTRTDLVVNIRKPGSGCR